MEKPEKKKNIFVRILLHPIFVNIVAMIVLGIIIVALALFGINKYTKHNESITVPNIKGLQIKQAEDILNKSTLKLEISDSIYLADGVPGAILDQVPKADAKVKKDRTIFLTVQAKTPQLVAIPDMKDLSLRQAMAMLTSLGFDKVRVTERPSYYSGIVLHLKYQGDTISIGQRLPKGTPIEMIIGAGGLKIPMDTIGVASDSIDIQTEEEEALFE